jgi:hypothetical protein
MGGLSSGTQRFCNKKCLGNAYVISAAQKVSPDVIDRQVEEIFRGNCPKCRGLGPIDVHKIHRVWSALVLTRWTTTSQVSCRSCAAKSQLGGVLFSAVLGWWGFPWGLILTPVQITRYVAGMCAGPDSSKPSDALRKLVLVKIGAEALQKSQPNTPPPLAK